MLVSENDEENENYAVQYNDILNTKEATANFWVERISADQYQENFELQDLSFQSLMAPIPVLLTTSIKDLRNFTACNH